MKQLAMMTVSTNAQILFEEQFHLKNQNFYVIYCFFLKKNYKNKISFFASKSNSGE